jgi:hypothetical protein
MWRLEVSSPRGNTGRQFLQFITVDRAEAAPAPSHLVEGNGLHGAIGKVDGRRTAVLFAASGDGGTAQLKSGADRLVVAGLTPGKHYHVSIDRSCTATIGPTEDPRDPVVTAGGYVNVIPTECELP